MHCCYPAPPALLSFPTRRSSDLPEVRVRIRSRLSIASNSSPSAIMVTTSSSMSSCHRDATCCVPVSDIATRSEEHTSELQSRGHLVCRLLLEKKKSTQLNVHNRFLISIVVLN